MRAPELVVQVQPCARREPRHGLRVESDDRGDGSESEPLYPGDRQNLPVELLQPEYGLPDGLLLRHHWVLSIGLVGRLLVTFQQLDAPVSCREEDGGAKSLTLC